MRDLRYMLPLDSLSSAAVVPSPSILRNDILKPTSLGFMKDIEEEESIKQTEVSTIINDNLKILKTVSLPKAMEFEALSKCLAKGIKENIEKDALHDTAVKLVKYAQNFYEKMELYFDAIFDFSEKLKERRQFDLFKMSKEYIMSDLPPSYIETLTLAFLTQCKYYDVFNYRIRRERLKLIGVRNNRPKFKRICEAHNRWVDYIHSSLDRMRNSRSRLIWYVDLHNCKTVKEAFKVKKLRKSNLDKEQFFSLLLDLQKQTEGVRATLIEMNRETFQVALDRKDPTVDFLVNVMEIMG